MQEETLEEELKKISKELYGDEYKLGLTEYNVLYTALEKAKEEGRKEVTKIYWSEEKVLDIQHDATTQYKEELLGKLPEEREIITSQDEFGDIETTERAINYGFNECLLLVKKIINE